ncbi:hypothetical protein MMC06_001193 [Schaereria dolodes]|nr:hypothetical protein [Schaereria dolodes]
MKIPFSSSNRGFRYEPVHGGERHYEKNVHSDRSWTTVLFFLSSIIGALTLGLVVGYFAGKRAFQQPEKDWLAPAGSVNHTFKYQRKFADAPTNATEKTWEVMFPRGRGFIQNPNVSPNMMGVAVYHQLHCLDAIRRGYYSALAGTTPSMHSDPPHMRHCIDYLRQSLLCNADTNLEPVDFAIGGVTGWGPRQCRDVMRILEWTDKWRAHNQTSILNPSTHRDGDGDDDHDHDDGHDG